MFTKKDSQMLSNVYNITLHYTCIKLCNSLDDSYFTEMQKAALLMYAIYPFKSTHLHIIVSGILIERDCFKMFELLRIWLISQHLAAHFSHCKAMIDNMVLNSGLYFIWYAPLSSVLCPLLLPLFYLCTLPPWILSPHLPLLPLVCWPWSFSGCSSTVRICNSCVVLSICFLIEGLWMLLWAISEIWFIIGWSIFSSLLKVRIHLHNSW